MPSPNPYKNAIECQNACNLSGVVGQFHRDLSKIWAEAREKGEGTDYVNTHPVVILYLDKLCDLAGYRDFPNDSLLSKFSKAYDVCFDRKEEAHV